MVELHFKNEFDPIAVYAAIVSTLAVIVTVWNFYRDRPRLSVKVTPDVMILGSVDPSHDERDLVAVQVTNRGPRSTIITVLEVWDCGNWWNAMRKVGVKFGTVTNPQPLGYPFDLPKKLESNARWSGYIRRREDIFPNLTDGLHVAVIRATHSDKPRIVRIPKRAKK